LIINELVTNVLKHAYREREAGDIAVHIGDCGDATTELSVTDPGRGLPADFDIHRAGTLGLQLVTTLSTQLEGKLMVEGGNGTTIRLRFSRD
jgi:two-component sensor histidine kinase